MADIDVAVVGAGPVGLVAAAELARRGVRVRVLDRQPGPVEHSNAAVLHVRTLELLEAMGMAERVVPLSYPLEYVSLHAFGRALGGIRLYGLDGPYAGPRTLGQAAVERVLIERLAELGVTIERASEVVALAQDEAGVQLTVRDAEGHLSALAARYVVGCDGARSTVREALGIAFTGERHEGFEFLHADCTLKWTYPSGRAYTFVAKDRFLALFPFDHDGAYRVLAAGPTGAAAGPPTLAELEAVLRSLADPDATLAEARWLARWQVGQCLAERFRQGRVFLAGDAAHTHVPVGGQGMNIGIQDAVNLAWKLAAVVTGRGPSALLDTYESERRPIAEEVLRHTDRGFHLMVQPSDFAGFALKLFGSSVVALESVQERLRRLLGEVSYGYRASALAEDLGGTIGPIAGERVIDGIVVRAADRRTMRLLQVLTGPDWQLLAFAGVEGAPPGSALLDTARQAVERFGPRLQAVLVTPGAAPADWPGPVLHDRERLIHDRYGVRQGALYLMRPDWYVGFRAPELRAAAALDYLERWLGHP